MSTTLQGPDTEVARSTRMSIAVIGPDAARRRIVTKALANSEDRTVKEYSAYPAEMSDLPRMMELNFDVIMIDLDSDENYALLIVQNISAISNAMVMVYSTRTDPNLLTLAKRAGARDFLPIPAEKVGETKTSSTAVVEEPEPEHAEAAGAVEDEDPGAWRSEDKPYAAPNSSFKSGATYPKAGEGQPPTRPANMPRPNPVPRDLRQWDGGPVRPVAPASVTEEPAPAPQRAEETILDPLVERASGYRSVLDTVFDAPTTAAHKRGAIETDADVLALFRQTRNEEPEKQSANWKKLALICAGPVLLVLVLLVVFIQRYQTASATTKPSGNPTSQSDSSNVAATTPAVSNGSSQSEIPKSWTPITAAVPGSPAPKPQASAATPIDSAMMDAQLSAQAKISRNMKTPAPEDPAPAALAPSTIDDSDTVPGTTFAGGNRVKVEPAVSAISAGVADGLLIHKTDPVYPKFAKDNRIGGTVVLKAMISKTGTLQGLRVVSGPKILGDAALQAARNWRYRPYTLNNQPIEVETSISVVFSLGKQ